MGIYNASTGEEIINEKASTKNNTKHVTDSDANIQYGYYLPPTIMAQLDKITDKKEHQEAVDYLRKIYQDTVDASHGWEAFKNKCRYVRKTYKDLGTALAGSFSPTGKEAIKSHVDAWDKDPSNYMRLDRDELKVFYRMLAEWRRMMGAAPTDMDAPLGSFGTDKTDRWQAPKGTMNTAEYKAKKAEIKKERKFKINNEAYSQLDLSDIYRSPEYNEFIYEEFDLNDEATRKILLACNEAEQDRVMMSWTSKLYEAMIDKVDDIDFGEIPLSKGKMSKLSNYERMQTTMQVMYDMFKHYKEANDPLDVIVTAIQNIESREAIWTRAYNLNIEFPMVTYNVVVLSIIEAMSYMLALCIDFIKSPTSDSFDIVIDRAAINKTKQHMIFSTLRRFNDACKKGQIDAAMNACIKTNAKASVNEAAGIAVALGALAAGVVVFKLVVPLIRDFIFLLYYTRVKLADYFELQAELLEYNAANMEPTSGIRTGDDAKKIAAKQMKIATKFRKLANTISIDSKTAESNASKAAVKARNNKAIIDDVLDSAPDSMTSVLF